MASPSEAGHNLEVLGKRLDSYLVALKLSELPPETHKLLTTLHELDPKGDAFRYTTVKDRGTDSFVPAKRPQATYVDVVAMADHFDSVLSLLDGLMVVLDEYRDSQDFNAILYERDCDAYQVP